MSTHEKQELVKHRITKARDTLGEVSTLIQNKFFSNAINRLYYASFYAVNALFLDKDIKAKSHAGVKQMLGLHFVKTGIVSEELSDFYTYIFELRHMGDYVDYIVFEESEVSALLPQAADFIARIEALLSK